jgi:hypothetical protein
MHSECKYLLLHDGLSRAKTQVQLRFRGYDSREYGVLSISACIIRQICPDTDKCSGLQPQHIYDQRLRIVPLQNGLDGVLVQGVLGCILLSLHSIHMSMSLSRVLWKGTPKRVISRPTRLFFTSFTPNFTPYTISPFCFPLEMPPKSPSNPGGGNVRYQRSQP